MRDNRGNCSGEISACPNSKPCSLTPKRAESSGSIFPVTGSMIWASSDMRLNDWSSAANCQTTSSFARKLVLDKTTPNLIRLPNFVQITLRFRCGNALVQYAMQKDERGHSHIGHTMNEHTPILESIHHPAERLEILEGGCFEIHRNVHVGHTQARDDAPLVCQRVVG